MDQAPAPLLVTAWVVLLLDSPPLAEGCARIRADSSQMRSSGFGTAKSVFKADPGACSRAECHHGASREYEQEHCKSFRASGCCSNGSLLV